MSLTGLSALLALLHHSQFYQEVHTMLTIYYPQPAIHPVSVAGVNSPLTTPLGSQDTAITLASGSFSDTFIGIGAQVKILRHLYQIHYLVPQEPGNNNFQNRVCSDR